MKPVAPTALIREFKIVEVFSDRVTLLMDDGRMFYAERSADVDPKKGDIGVLKFSKFDDQDVPVRPVLTALK